MTDTAPGRTALVVGARGIIGGTLAAHLAREGWEVVGLSRRGGEPAERLRHVAVDLLDAPATRAALAPLTGVTHVFYAAYQDRPTWSELVAPNVAMLRNVLDAVEPVAAGLEHVSLTQGFKVYGAHLGPFKTPAREDDDRHMPPEFNLDQQDLLAERAAAGGGWTWSALRPSVVSGFALGIPMNLTLAIAVYGSIARELGVPMRFPGKPGAYRSLLEFTDADLLAQAAVWAATDPRAAGEAFNITNGDLVRWEHLWPRLAADFEVEAAEPLPMALADVMADKQPVWDRMAARHGLADVGYAAVSAWPSADGVFSWDYDMFSDSGKARRLGFHAFVDTEAMFLARFAELRERRIIPA